MNKSLFIVCFLVSACGQQGNSSSNAAAPSLPNIPSYSGTELAKLGKNQFEEIERRCMDQPKHPTCVALNGNEFKLIVGMNKTACSSSKTLNDMGGGLGGSSLPTYCWRH